MPAIPVPQIPRPALRVPLKDPTFGTMIMRITDPAMSPDDGANRTMGLIHEYSRFPVLSCDNQKIIVQVLGGQARGAWEVRNITTGALVNRVPIDGDPEFSWSATDPNGLFYRSGNRLQIFHADSGQAETPMAFPQYAAIGTNEEGRPSDDWHYYAFLGRKSGGTEIVVADLVAKRILAMLPAAGEPDWAGMSPSGQYVVIMWGDERGTLVYDRTLTTKRQLMGAFAHSDFAIDAQGNEVLVYQATEGAQITELACPNPPSGAPIASARLSDGKKTILLGDCNKADWTPVITGELIGWNWWTPHFSGIASRRVRGWVLVSTYIGPSTAQHPFAREIFWLALDGSGQTKHVAHHHSDQTVNSENKKDYWAEPHATSSWDGSLVVFSSCWGSPWARYDCYVAGAPKIPAPPVQPPPQPPPPTPPATDKQLVTRATALLTELQKILAQLLAKAT